MYIILKGNVYLQKADVNHLQYESSENSEDSDIVIESPIKI